METQRFDGKLTVGEDPESAISVEVAVDDRDLSIDGAAGNLGRWPRQQLRVAAREDGFHLRIEGEEIILNLTDDAEFAVAMGVRSASPLLRRKIASLLRHD